MQLGAVAVTMATLVALAGCGRSTEAPSAAAQTAGAIGSGPATGTITMWAMGAEGEALPAFVSTFEKANPGVKVDVTAIPWDAAHNKFQTAIAGGNTPDIAMMGSTWMADFATAFATVPTDIDISGFFEGAVGTTKVADRPTGVPWYVDTRVLYYRTDLAEKAGWVKAPTSWAELKQMASDLKSKAGAKYGIRLPAGTDSFQGTLWMPWSNGASLSDGSKWTLDTPETVKAYEYYQSFFKDGIANPSADTSAGAQEAAFVDGSTPMLIDGPFEMGQLKEIGGAGFADKYTTAVLPTEKSSTSFSGGANLVVFAKSKNQSSAWKLAQWLSEPETQAAWYGATGDLPAAQSAWSSSALTADPKLAVFGEQLKTAKAPPATTTWVQVAAAADTALEEMRRGGTSVPNALKGLQSKADSIGMG
jgi:multiple sugar transport system substrate-binding protein